MTLKYLNHLYSLLTGLILFPLLSSNVVAVTKIACVGDSITQGVPYYNSRGNGCVNCGGYEPKLDNLLDNNDWASTVYNYGVAGEWSNGGASRIPGIISSKDPEYVLFMEGTNDLSFSSPSTVRARIEVGINNILAEDKIPVIGTLLPDTRGNNNNSKRIPQTNSLIRNMLSDMNVQLAEFYNATSYNGWAGRMADGIHPNQSGYQLMADVWYAALLEAKPNHGFLPAVYLLLLN